MCLSAATSSVEKQPTVRIPGVPDRKVICLANPIDFRIEGVERSIRERVEVRQSPEIFGKMCFSTFDCALAGKDAPKVGMPHRHAHAQESGVITYGALNAL